MSTAADKKKKHPLSVRSRRADTDQPFAGDLFEREKFSERLTEIVQLLPDGGVIAIDAKWGEGKSWLARNWSKALEVKGFPTVLLDAFEADFIEDPFLLVTAELLPIIDGQSPERGKKVRAGARKMAAVLAPIAAKAMIKAAATAVMGIDLTKSVDAIIDSAEQSAGEDAASLIDGVIKKRLDELQSRRKTMSAFREQLAGAAGAFHLPVVFIVDELDRCKPPFAIQLLERIKHFFAVPNVVFVLFMNRLQLEASVRGMYGEGIDSNIYLSKFVSLTLKLPDRISLEAGRKEFAQRFCDELGRRLGYENLEWLAQFKEALASIAPLFRMSFRELEKAFAYLGVAGNVGVSASLVAYLCALRISQPALFERIASENDPAAHAANYRFLNEVRGTATNDRLPWIFRVCEAAHAELAKNQSGIPNADTPALVEFRAAFLDRVNLKFAEVFAFWARRIELQVP